MPTLNYTAMQARAAKLINKYGMPAKLQRGTSFRDCIAVEMDESSKDTTKMTNPTNRMFLLAAKGLTIPPDREAGDILVIYKPPGYTVVDSQLKIAAPVTRLAPANVAVYYELEVYEVT